MYLPSSQLVQSFSPALGCTVPAAHVAGVSARWNAAAIGFFTGMSEDGIPRVPGQEFTLREEDGGDTFASAHMGSVDIDALRDVMRPLQLHRGSTQGAVVDLALACLVDAPNERPTMEQMERRLGEAVDEKTAASEDGP